MVGRGAHRLAAPEGNVARKRKHRDVRGLSRGVVRLISRESHVSALLSRRTSQPFSCITSTAYTLIKAYIIVGGKKKITIERELLITHGTSRMIVSRVQTARRNEGCAGIWTDYLQEYFTRALHELKIAEDQFLSQRRKSLETGSERVAPFMPGICFSSRVDRSRNGAWPLLSFYRTRKGFFASPRCSLLSMMLEYFSRSFDESLTSGGKKKTEKGLIFEDSSTFAIENYLWSLDRVSPARRAGEEASKRVILPRMHLEECAHEMADALWRPPLSRIIRASFSVSRSFLPCRKTCDSMHETFYCVTCAVFSGLCYCPRVPEIVRINSHCCIILSAATQVNQ